MKATIYDVADRAGVSIATVSRYINQKGSVAAKSEQKICRAIQELEYVPEAAAQNLAGRSSMAVGVYIANISLDNYYVVRVLSGAFEVLHESGRELLITYFGDKAAAEYSNDVLTRKRMDGIIFGMTNEETEPYIRDLYEKGVPLAYVGARFEWDRIGCNVYGGFSAYRRDVIELLIEEGCRRILCLELTDETLGKMSRIIRESSGPDRFLPPVCLGTGLTLRKGSEKEVYEWLVQIFLQEDRPDAVFFADPDYAPYVYAAAGAAGLRIPADLRLISMIHSDRQDGRFVPNLAVVYIDAYQMGINAGKKIIALMEKKPIPEGLDTVAYEIRRNETI